MKSSLFTLFCLFLLSCAHGNLQKSWNPSDLLVSENISVEPPLKLNAQEQRSDVSFVIYTLDKAYGGRKFVPREQLDSAIAALKYLSIEGSLPPRELCERIAIALSKIQDMHLNARLGSEICAEQIKKERKPNVGKNVYDKNVPPWAVNYISILKRKVPILSITALPPQQDSSWNGFLDVIRDLKKKAPAIIVDLRGNGGGDDTMGSLMAEILYGQKFPTPVLSQVKSKTPETMAIRMNNPTIRIARLKRNGKTVPDYWYSKLKTAKRDYEEALQGKFPEEVEEIVASGPDFDPRKGFAKPIIFLIDAACASSCESMIDFFENHPKAITIGENTGGFMHFGNMGFVVLPQSKILIQMASDFWKYKDGRYIEGIGIAPKVSVQPGKDALEKAKELLTAEWGGSLSSD